MTDRSTPAPAPGTCHSHEGHSIRLRSLEARMLSGEQQMRATNEQITELRIWIAKFVGGLSALLAALQVALRFLPLGIVLLIAGCAAPWTIARGSLAGARGALDAIEQVDTLPQSELEHPLSITREALDLGEIAIDVWEQLGDDEPPPGWQKWSALALRGIDSVIGVIKACGVVLPQELQMALLALHALLPLLGAT